MSEFLELASTNWEYSLVVSSVPKDGSHFKDSFLLNVNKPIYYWSQLYNFTSPIEVEVEVGRTEGRLAASISVKGKTEMPCSRCLMPAKVAIDGTLNYFFSLRPNKFLKEEEQLPSDGDEDLIIVDSWKKDIDLVPLIWEVLITSLPATGLCTDQCKGLCPKCGMNLNESYCSCKKEDEDPRFEVLRSFLKDKK